MPITRVPASQNLRRRLETYLRRHGRTMRVGRNGRSHPVRSYSSHLRHLLEKRFGEQAPMTQQAISNFLSGRSSTIRLDHATMLAQVIGLQMFPRQQGPT